jgi:hypothetical protein
MSIYLFDATTFDIVFEFDCELSEERGLEVEWTDKPVEAGYDITHGGHVKPEVFPLEGMVTAWPIGEAVNQGRVIAADKALRDWARSMKPITVVTGWWAEEVVLSKVNSKGTTEDGDAMRISLECRQVKTVTPTVTTVPPSRLKPSVKSGAALKAKTGAGAKATPPAPAQASATTAASRSPGTAWVRGQAISSGYIPPL